MTSRAAVCERQILKTPSRSSAFRHHETAVTLVWWQSDCAQCVVDVSEMRIPMAQSTRRNYSPNLTSQAEMILSGVVLGDLRHFEATKIGKQLYELGFSGSGAGEARNGNWISLRISRQASRVCASRPTRNCMCVFIEDGMVLKHQCKHKRQTIFHDTHFLTRAQGELQSASDKVCRVQPVGGIKIRIFGRTEESLEEAGDLRCDLLAGRDIAEFYCDPSTETLDF